MLLYNTISLMDIALFLVQPLTVIMKNMNQLTEAQYPAKTLDSGFHVNQTIYPNNLTPPPPPKQTGSCVILHHNWKNMFTWPENAPDSHLTREVPCLKLGLKVLHEAQEQDSHQNIGLLQSHTRSVFCSVLYSAVFAGSG